MELFAKIINGLELLSILAKKFISDVWLGSEWTSDSDYSDTVDRFFGLQHHINTNFENQLFGFWAVGRLKKYSA